MKHKIFKAMTSLPAEKLIEIIYMKVISWKIFFVSFLLGLFFVYILGKTQKVVMVYPTLTNSSNILFRDKAGQCFRFKAKALNCPKNIADIKQIPIQ